MSKKAHSNNGAAATPLELHHVSWNPNAFPGLELAFAGMNPGLKPGDTISASMDGVTATFKLGRSQRSETVKGGSLGNGQPKPCQVFEAQIVDAPLYYVVTLLKGEPRLILPPAFLTPTAARGAIEWAREEAKAVRWNFDTVSVFEVGCNPSDLGAAAMQQARCIC